MIPGVTTLSLVPMVANESVQSRTIGHRVGSRDPAAWSSAVIDTKLNSPYIHLSALAMHPGSWYRAGKSLIDLMQIRCNFSIR